VRRLLAGRVVSLVVLVGFVIVAATANWFSGGDAAGSSLERQLSGGGSDVFWAWWARATRSAVIIVASASALGLLLGTSLGAAAVYGGRGLAALLTRLVEFIGAVPGLILVGILRLADPSEGIASLIAALALLRTLEVAQLVRAQVITLLPSDFVEAARALGASRRWQLRVHILPRLVQPVLVNTLLGASALLGLEAALSFVGLGLPSTTPSWGGGLSVLAHAGHTGALWGVVASISVASAALYGLGTSLAAAPPPAFARSSPLEPLAPARQAR
jgi:peptide/nickel transport system permease protein